MPIPPHSELPHWSARFITWLEQLCPEGLNPGADCLRITIEELKQQRKRITWTIRRLRHYTRDNPTVKVLRTVPGFGFITAVTFYAELMDMGRFSDLEDLCCYIGLVPGSNDSGDRQRGAELSSLGNQHLRYMLIEASWVAVRTDDDLLHFFSRQCKYRKKQKAIIKVARKLLNRMRTVWLKQLPYQSPAVVAA